MPRYSAGGFAVSDLVFCFSNRRGLPEPQMIGGAG